jgi:hypothetical protein
MTESAARLVGGGRAQARNSQTVESSRGRRGGFPRRAQRESNETASGKPGAVLITILLEHT